MELLILGTVQDGGSPHIGCEKSCCSQLFTHPDPTRAVTSLGIINRKNGRIYLLEATPDMSRQIQFLNQYAGNPGGRMPDGVLLTHAHIGHYSGLMYFGREAKGTKEVPVYTLPRMADYLRNNGPWSQLCSLQNIVLKPLQQDSVVRLDEQISVRTFTVPHRDEYSETAGFLVNGPSASFLFIPDIDKWSKWHQKLEDLLNKVDYAFIDATFYDAAEINHRNMSEIPHPFVVESMAMLGQLGAEVKNKIYFIHLNHTNPLLDTTSAAYRRVRENGYHVAGRGLHFSL